MSQTRTPEDWRVAVQRKDFVTAERLLSEILAGRPGDGPGWRDLALLRHRLGSPQAAVDAFRTAIDGGVAEAAIAFDYGLALSDVGHHDDAARVVGDAVRDRKRDFKLTNLMGVVLKRAGRFAEAVTWFHEARKLEPKSHSPWTNLGNTYLLQGDAAKAVDAYGRATRLDPKRAENWRLLGRAQKEADDLDGATRSFKRALFLEPRNTAAVTDLAGLYLDTRQLDAAAAITAKARETDSDSIRLALLEARIMKKQGRTEECRVALDAILARSPRETDALFLMARLLEGPDRKTANDYFRRTVEVEADSLEAAAALCESLNRSRYDDEAKHIQEAYDIATGILDRFGARAKTEAKTLRGILGRCCDFDRLEQTGSLAELGGMWIRRNQVSALHFELGSARDLAERIQLVEWHRTWGRRVEAAIEPIHPVGAPAIVGRRKLRVGFMSSDLRHHPVTYFVIPLLEMYDREKVEVFCYSFYERARDNVQAIIERSVDGFRWWPRQPEAKVAEGIARDDLDILFELGGSTDMNKLEVMAYRPARLGASWLGYPHSAGLERIDYLLVDPYIKPEDPRLLIEKPFELPETWVTLGRVGFVDYPIEPEIPEVRNGFFTFGTMNNPYKYGPAPFDAWARAMHGVPGSKFLFVRPEGAVPAFRANVEREFARRGIDADRVTYIAVRGTHMQHYNAIDVALDTFPHVGGTTTCETLWMGVPTVTLVGPAFFERLSYSNLNNCGLGDLCAFTVDDYVAAAVALAEDRSRRAALRTGLRERIRSHPLGQAERFVKAFYDSVERVVRQ